MSIFTQNLWTAFDAAERLDASAVMINEHTAFRIDWMPFAGRRQSGYGIGGISWTMRENDIREDDRHFGITPSTNPHLTPTCL